METNRIVEMLGQIPKPLQPLTEWLLYHVPYTRRKIEEYRDKIIQEVRKHLKSSSDQFPDFKVLPKSGGEAGVILKMLEVMAGQEESWKQGFASGAVYREEPHAALANEVQRIFADTNPLHTDQWPSLRKFTREIVSMTANMLGANAAGNNPPKICGMVTAGGTDSILHAMYAYREWAETKKGIKCARIVAPSTAHAAFDKAAKMFRMEIVHVPVGKDFRADVWTMKKAVTKNTAVIIGSAPAFPHGVIDPIGELSEFARTRGIGFHTDACLGGFVLPWAKKLGYPVPLFDFRLPGVTSISADTHKYGYAAKGTSVILYRWPELLQKQFYALTDWPGGLYATPTFAGSRPGALIAMCWAAMVSIGRQGYLESTEKILKTADFIQKEISAIPELHILGNPLWVIAFTSDSLNIYGVLDEMNKRGWSLNGLISPSAIHLCITLRHTQAGVAERFIADLKASVKQAKLRPDSARGMAAIYGTAAKLPTVLKRTAEEILREYLFCSLN